MFTKHFSLTSLIFSLVNLKFEEFKKIGVSIIIDDLLEKLGLYSYNIRSVSLFYFHLIMKFLL